jgi:hypothetical protein
LSMNGVSINRVSINGVSINRVSINGLSIIRGGAFFGQFKIIFLTVKAFCCLKRTENNKFIDCLSMYFIGFLCLCRYVLAIIYGKIGEKSFLLELWITTPHPTHTQNYYYSKFFRFI